MEILKLKQIIEINPTNEFKSRLGKAEYKIYELKIVCRKHSDKYGEEKDGKYRK